MYINVEKTDVEATTLKIIRIILITTHPKHNNLATLKDIIKGCKNFDERFQKVLYERFFGYALKIVFRYIYRYEKAIDVTNDGFVKLFNGFDAFELKNDDELQKILMGWMRRIMVNTAIDELRRQNMMPEIGRLPDYVWEEPDRNGGADNLILYKELIAEIKNLPPSYRVIFNMYVIDGYSHQEIADMLGISLGTSKSSLSKARVHLQKYLIKNSTTAEACKI